MSFLNNSYKAYSLKWFIQRTIVVIKERRLPQLGVLPQPKKKKAEPVQKIKPEKIKQKAPASVPKKPELKIDLFEVKIPDEQKQANRINTYFDCIYLLNLKHRSDKRLKSIYQLKQMGISALIVEVGINGYQSPHIEDYEKYAIYPLYEKDAHPLEFKIGRKCISSPGHGVC